jgi:ADP-ribose pyrophosphatase
MREVITELPAGKLEWGEEPDAAAERELREETGLAASELRRVGVIYPSPGYCGEKLYLYIARGLTQGEQRLDEGERLNCRRIPMAEAVELALGNGIKDAKSIVLILLADRLAGRGDMEKGGR